MLGYHRTCDLQSTTLKTAERDLCTLAGQTLIIELKSDVPVCRWESDAVVVGDYNRDVRGAQFELSEDFGDWAGLDAMVIRVYDGSIRLEIVGG
jgi:hypothetical protein